MKRYYLISYINTSGRIATKIELLNKQEYFDFISGRKVIAITKLSNNEAWSMREIGDVYDD